METVACLFCGIESDDIAIQENGFLGRRCRRCGLIYISPRPTPGDILDLYGHGAAHASPDAHIAAELSRRLYARHNLRTIQRFVRTGALLEIGAGAGYFLDEARSAGFEPFGIELNPVQAQFVRDRFGIPCEERPLSGTSFGGRRFDVVYHCDVLSHFPDPVDAFQSMRAALADDGWLVFETGNVADVHPRYLRYFERFQYPDHLFFFGEASLQALLDSTGFERIDTRRYSIMPQLHLVAVLQGLKRLVNRSGNDRPVGEPSAPRTRPAVPGRALSAIRRLDSVLRYRAGRLVPKAGRPQTVVILARKRR